MANHPWRQHDEEGSKCACGHCGHAQACLSHREADNVKAAYNRAQFAAERRALLISWANYLSGQAPSNVVQINDIRAAA